jgi:hypothetical protein
MTKARTKTQIATELGAKIDAHLKRFENDPTINKPRDGKREGVRPFYMAGSSGVRHRVWVRYVSYQGGSFLSVEDATSYLAWLDAGNIGTHHKLGIRGHYHS